MSLSVVLPTTIENLSHATAEEILLQLATTGRQIVFFDESIYSFIIYKGPIDIDRSTHSLHVNASILPSDIVENRELESFSKVTVNGPEAINFSIFDATLDDTKIIHKDLNNNEICIVWKVEIPVTYPRKKFPNPRLLISCRLSDPSLQLNDCEKSVTPVEEHLIDYQPTESSDLLSELYNLVSSPGSGKPLELSSSLVLDNKVNGHALPILPESPTSSLESESALTASFNVPVSVSLVIKLRSTKPAGRNNILLATLNIESSDELNKLLEDESDDIYFKITNLELEFKFGTVKEFRAREYEYPIRFRFGDSINLTYKFLNNEFLDKELKLSDDSNTQFSKPLNIKLVLQMERRLSDGYHIMSNVITTHWCPFLDFNIIAPPINNALKTSANYSQLQSQPTLQKLNSQPNGAINGNARKTALLNNLYKTGSTPNTSAPALSIQAKRVGTNLIGSSASSVTVNLTTNTNSTLSGLKLTFVGKLNIKLGEIVNWKIQAINNSKNRLKVSLIVQNPLNFSPTIPTNEFAAHNLENLHSRAQLLNIYNLLKLKTSGVIILNNDIRIGPMDSNTVYETNIMLVGLLKGIFNLDGIKVFDVNSGDGLDFGKLVEVFVVE